MNRIRDAPDWIKSVRSRIPDTRSAEGGRREHQQCRKPGAPCLPGINAMSEPNEQDASPSQRPLQQVRFPIDGLTCAVEARQNRTPAEA